MSVWIFGYGSLMWDTPWQQAHGCMSAQIADIQGYRRVFNKPSVTNRGTPEKPGVALNLMPEKDAICTGMALEFDDQIQDKLMADLAAREHQYTRHQRMVRLTKTGQTIGAHVYIYEQADVIKSDCCNHIAQIALGASGSRGSGRDYVVNTALALERLGIVDPEVTRVYQALKSRLS